MLKSKINVTSKQLADIGFKGIPSTRSLLKCYICYGVVADYRRVCYVNNWAQYRPPPANFIPSQTDPSLCSHILFSYAVIDSENRIQPYEWNDDMPGGLYVSS